MNPILATRLEPSFFYRGISEVKFIGPKKATKNGGASVDICETRMNWTDQPSERQQMAETHVDERNRRNQ